MANTRNGDGKTPPDSPNKDSAPSSKESSPRNVEGKLTPPSSPTKVSPRKSPLKPGKFNLDLDAIGRDLANAKKSPTSSGADSHRDSPRQGFKGSPRKYSPLNQSPVEAELQDIAYVPSLVDLDDLTKDGLLLGPKAIEEVKKHGLENKEVIRVRSSLPKSFQARLDAIDGAEEEDDYIEVRLWRDAYYAIYKKPFGNGASAFVYPAQVVAIEEASAKTQTVTVGEWYAYKIPLVAKIEDLDRVGRASKRESGVLKITGQIPKRDKSLPKQERRSSSPMRDYGSRSRSASVSKKVSSSLGRVQSDSPTQVEVGSPPSSSNSPRPFSSSLTRSPRTSTRGGISPRIVSPRYQSPRMFDQPDLLSSSSSPQDSPRSVDLLDEVSRANSEPMFEMEFDKHSIIMKAFPKSLKDVFDTEYEVISKMSEEMQEANPYPVFSPAMKLKVLQDIAEKMAYFVSLKGVHQSGLTVEHGMIHGDIKLQNVAIDLITQRADLIDFGDAKFLNEQGQYLSDDISGTSIYIDTVLRRAAVNGNGVYPHNEQTELFAFGMLIADIFDMVDSDKIIRSEDGKTPDLVKMQDELAVEFDQTIISKLVKKLTDPDPSRRGTFKDAIVGLAQIVELFKEYSPEMMSLNVAVVEVKDLIAMQDAPEKREAFFKQLRENYNEVWLIDMNKKPNYLYVKLKNELEKAHITVGDKLSICHTPERALKKLQEHLDTRPIKAVCKLEHPQPVKENSSEPASPSSSPRIR